MRLRTFSRAATCIVLLFTSLCHAQSFAPVLAYDRPDEYGIVIARDILVPMRDGFRLTCDLYQPSSGDGKPASGSFPSFVYQYHGYGRTSSQNDGPIKNFATKGYYVALCNTRGSQGWGGASPAPQSVALINPWSEKEQEDNYDLIEWLAAQPWSNGRVGQAGGSYGGITTWLVASRQRPPHLKAIAPIVAGTDMYRHSTYPGGIPSSDLRGIWPALCSYFTGELTCTPRLTIETQSHRVFDDYWEERRADLTKISIPTLYLEGQFDIFAGSVNQIISQQASNPNFSLVLGPWGHENIFYTGTSTTLPAGVLLSFFDRWLAGRGGAAPLPRFAVYRMPFVDQQDRWSAFNAFPPAAAESVRYGLGADGTLQRQGASAGLVSYIATTGALTFDTPAFAGPATLAGPVEVTLAASFNTTDMNVFARVDLVDSAGNVTDMGYGAQLKMSHRESDRNPSPIVPGLLYPVKLSIPAKFWDIPAGQKLRLTIKSVDATSAEAVPLLGIVTLQTGASASYVDVHLLQASGSN